MRVRRQPSCSSRRGVTLTSVAVAGPAAAKQRRDERLVRERKEAFFLSCHVLQKTGGALSGVPLPPTASSCRASETSLKPAGSIIASDSPLSRTEDA